MDLLVSAADGHTYRHAGKESQVSKASSLVTSAMKADGRELASCILLNGSLLGQSGISTNKESVAKGQGFVWVR